MEFDWIVKQKFGKNLGEMILVLANEWRHPFDKVMETLLSFQNSSYCGQCDLQKVRSSEISNREIPAYSYCHKCKSGTPMDNIHDEDEDYSTAQITHIFRENWWYYIQDDCRWRKAWAWNVLNMSERYSWAIFRSYSACEIATPLSENTLRN